MHWGTWLCLYKLLNYGCRQHPRFWSWLHGFCIFEQFVQAWGPPEASLQNAVYRNFWLMKEMHKAPGHIIQKLPRLWIHWCKFIVESMEWNYKILPTGGSCFSISELWSNSCAPHCILIFSLRLVFACRNVYCCSGFS